MSSAGASARLQVGDSGGYVRVVSAGFDINSRFVCLCEGQRVEDGPPECACVCGGAGITEVIVFFALTSVTEQWNSKPGAYGLRK